MRSLLASALTTGALLSVMTAFGGSVTYNFDTDPVPALDIYQTGFTDSSGTSRYWGPTGGNPASGGFLGLTWPLGSATTIVLFPDIDAGNIVSAFTLDTDLRIGNPQQNERAADGFSINFARLDDPVFVNHSANDFATSGAVETGTRTGLAICFDTWSGNALPDGTDIEGIIVRVDNVTVNRTSVPTRNGACDDNTSLQTGPRDLQYWQNNPVDSATSGDSAFAPASWSNLCWQHLTVEVSTNSQITVTWKGRKILDKYQSTFFPSAGGIVLAGRTGGADEHSHFDNLTLTTVAAAADTTPPTNPGPIQALTTGAYRVVLRWDASTDDSMRVGYEIEQNGTNLAGAFTSNTNELKGLSPSTAYQFRVRATDVSGNKSAWTPVLSLTTAADVTDTAYAAAKVYDNITGTPVFNLITDAKYPDSPDRTLRLGDMWMSFGEPLFGDTFGENLGVRIAGTVTPPETGQYNFFIRSDDASQLYLNTSGATIPQADDASYIAQETGCCNAFQEVGAVQTTATPIQLTAGQKYGILFVVKEGGGGDWGQVAWRKVGDTTAATALQPIAFPYFESEANAKADPVGAVVTITQQPQPQTIVANTTVSFSIAATFSSPYATTALYHWYKNGVGVATGTSYTIPYAPTSENGAKIKCVVSVPGLSVTSDEVTLTVNPDNVPPTLVDGSAHGSADFQSVTFKFSEPVVAPSATTAGNYTISGGVTVSAAALVGVDTVKLTTSTQPGGTELTITVNNVQDKGGNPIAANSTILFKSFVAPPQGYANYQQWPGYTATQASLDAFVPEKIGLGGAAPTAPSEPTAQGLVQGFEMPTWENGSSYGGRLQGIFIAPATADYVFFVTSDDQSYLLLSTDATPANKKKIATETGWSNARQWLAIGGGSDLTAKRSDQWTATEWPTGNRISLVQGNRYYIEGAWVEGGGGDGLGATYRLSTEADSVVTGASRIAGALLEGIVPIDPWVGAPVIKTQPVSVAVDAGGTATLSVEVGDGARPLSYQWQRGWVNIAGATASTLTITSVDASKVGDYKVIVSNAAGSATSTPAVVTLKSMFLIEAEDFDYTNGLRQAVADTMPYKGFAYDGLSATYNVDYHNDNNDSITYRRGGDIAVSGQGVSMDNATGNYLSLDRGAWAVTNNYKIGWIGTGDWHNYTRAIPAGDYTAYAALSYDGSAASQLKAKLSKVTAGVGTPTQTLADLGTFDQEGSRGWGRNNLVPMKDAGGAMAVFNVAGAVTTLRMSHDSGDFDWLMLVPAAAAGPKIDSIVVTGGKIVMTWQGAATLQSTATVPAADAAWTDVAGATSPTSLNPPATGNIYYRLKQ